MAGPPVPTSVRAQPQSSHPAPGQNKGPSATTNPLALLSPKQIVAQARNTISSAYAPSYKSLNQMGAQATALAAKRTADNKYYQSWLDTQGAALQQHADMAQQSLNDAAKGIGTQPLGNAGFTGMPGSANANAVGQTQGALQGGLAAAQSNAASTGAIGQGLVGSALANNQAYVQAGQQKDNAALDTSLTAIANSKTKLQGTEGADLAKEIGRLQGVNISVAQHNQAFGALSQKLGITAANTQSEINTRAANVNLGAQRNNIALSRAQQAQMSSGRTYKLNVAKYDASTAKDLYERQNGLGPYRVKTPAGQKPLSVTSQNSIYNKVSAVQGELRQLIANGATPQQAYHTLLNGASVNVDTGRDTKAGQTADQTNPNSKVGEVVRTQTYKSPDVQILNAAYNAATGNGLTPGDVAALKKMGLANPGSRLKLSPGSSVTGRGVSSAGKGLGGL